MVTETLNRCFSSFYHRGTTYLLFHYLFVTSNNNATVDSRYLEIEGTLLNTSRYPYFDISDL